MKRGVLAACVAALVFCAPAQARDSFPLHPHSSGPRVAGLQWLLGGHRPNVFNKVKPTFRHRPNGFWGPRTTSALNRYRYRIGYPGKGQCGSRVNMWAASKATGYLFNLLKGKAKRPICWVGLAAKRVKGAVRPGATAAALAIQKLEVEQLGVAEQPLGSNRGCRISYTCDGFGPYQGATGAYGAAWCASFQQWAFMNRAPDGRFADDSAYVPYIADWAQRHNFLVAKPRVGSLVVFLNPDRLLVNAYHIGYVVRVTASGVQTVEGNYSDGVHEVWRPYSTPMVYVDIPGVS